jgi:hypothetical protein
MQKILLSLLLFANSFVFCQSGDTINAEEKRARQRDSVMEYYKNKRDSLTRAIQLSDTDLIKQNFRNSTDYFVRLQKENRAKQKKAAMIRIAIGVGLFAILIIGLRRKKKKIGE